MRIGVNAVSAKMAGATTYLFGMLDALGQWATSRGASVTVWRSATLAPDSRWPEGIAYNDYDDSRESRLKRVMFYHRELPGRVGRAGLTGLFSAANFGPLRPPCRHVLQITNAIYFDEIYGERMKGWKSKAMLAAQRRLMLECLSRADAALFPTRAMMNMVSRAVGGKSSSWQVATYGYDRQLFRPDEVRTSGPATDAIRLLNVSTYSDQKNLTTLLEALKLLDAGSSSRFQLTLTAGFEREDLEMLDTRPNLQNERMLYRDLSRRGLVRDINWQVHRDLPEVYRAADVFVFPSYVESFGHPLLEAMACGVPIAASDIPTNREICGEAAAYFAPLDPYACAEAIRTVSEDATLWGRLREAGLRRVKDFSWEHHVDILTRQFVG